MIKVLIARGVNEILLIRKEVEAWGKLTIELCL